MDKNQITGIVLMVALYIGYIWYTAPTEADRIAAKAEQERLIEEARLDSVNRAEEAQFQESLRSMPVAELDSAEQTNPDLERRFGMMAQAAVGTDRTYTLSSPELEVVISNRGGLPVRSTLKNFHRYQSEELVELWDERESSLDVLFQLNAISTPISMADLHFEVEKQSENTLVLISQNQLGQRIKWTHQIEGYEINSSLSFEGFRGAIADDYALNWEVTGIPNEKGIDWERQHSSIYFKEVGMGRDYLTDGRSDEVEVEEKLEWMAFKQNFFSTIVGTPEGFLPGSILKTNIPEEDSTLTMQYAARLGFQPELKGDEAITEFKFYFGPNEQIALENSGLEEADRIIDYGWWIFGWVNRNAILPLYKFLANHIGSAGLIILVITLIIKFALSPITWKNFVSSAKMKVLRPEIEEINKKHEDDAMAKQQATMALYRQTGVNPLAGCIPALLQMPVLYAMFRFFPSNIDMRGQSFLWADDLGAFDSILDLPFAIPFYGAHVSGFTFLMAVSTFFYMRMTMANQPPQPQQPGMPNMKVIQQIFPFMMLFFFNQFASGLSLYYLTANVISIGQMVLIKSLLIDEDKIRAQIDENKAKPRKKSSFQERLEKLQREQLEKTKEIKGKKRK